MGVNHTIILLQKASCSEISTLDPDYSPISMVMRHLHTRVNLDTEMNRRNIDVLTEIVDTCLKRGIKVNGCDHIDGELERPLVLAASLGKATWVEALLIAGAHPSETDGRGRNAFYAAFDDRDMTKHWFEHSRSIWHEHNERHRQDCAMRNRIKIAHLMFQTGLLTPSLSLSRANNKMLHINSQTSCGTPLPAALVHQNKDEYLFLVNTCKATLTDKDCLTLRQLNKLYCLKNAVKMVADFNLSIKCASTTTQPARKKSKTHSLNEESLDALAHFDAYSKNNSWSFPPTHHVAIQLTKYFGLPPDVFRQHLQPFLARDWFFTEKDLQLDVTNEEIRDEFQGCTF